MALSDNELFSFVTERLDELKQIDLPQSAFLYEIESASDLAAEDFDKRSFFEQVLADRENLVLDLCLSKEEVYLDYWGTTFKAFGTDNPKGSIPIEELLPSLAEESYLLLLQPIHAEQILKSLNEHRNDLIVMNDESIAKVTEFKERCEQNSDYLVAYVYDF